MNLLFAALLTLASFHVSGNFPRDLYGALDTRDQTWGRAEAQTLPIKFSPPPGYRVRILALRGDLTAFPKLPDAGTLPPNRYAGVLMGFNVSTDEPNPCDFCALAFPVYVQDSISSAVDHTRAPFNYEHLDLLLPPDHTLFLKIAAYLNTFEVPIHVEGTWSAQVRFEKEK